MVSGLVFASCVLLASAMVWSRRDMDRDEAIDQLNEFLQQTDLKVIDKENDVTNYAYCYKKTADEFYENYFIEIPQFKSFKDLERLHPILENHFKKTLKCEITNNFEYILKVRKNNVENIETMLPFELINVSKTSELCFCSGKSMYGYEYINFSKIPNLLMAGATGWGKSVGLKGCLLQLIHNYSDSLELVLMDFKGGVELRQFSRIRQTTHFIFKPWECSEVLKEIYEEIENRLDKFRELDVVNISEFNKKSKEKMKFKVVVIEEFTILMDYSKEVFEVLTKSISISRATGITFILVAQRFDSTNCDPKIKSNIDNRICYRVSDSVNSRVILDSDGAEKLNAKGRAILSRAGEKVEFQSFFITDDDVQKVINANLRQNKAILEPLSEGEINNKGKSLKGITGHLTASDDVIERMI